MDTLSPHSQKPTLKKFNEIDFGNPDDVNGFITNAIESSVDSFREVEGEWHRNIAFYTDRQYVSWDIKRRDFVTQNPAYAWQAKTVTNLIKPTVRNQVARLTKAEPSIMVTPATSDDEDIQISNLSTKVCRAYNDKLKMRSKRTEFFYWLILTGQCFYRVSWNTETGGSKKLVAQDFVQQFSADPMEQQMFLAQAQEKLKSLTDQDYLTVNMGDVEVEVLSPFCVRWDLAQPFNKSPWVVVTKVYDKATAEAKWPRFAGKFETTDKWRPTTGVYNKSIATNAYEDEDGKSVTDLVVCHELFIRGTSKNPTGHYAVQCGGQLVESGANPYADEENFDDIPVAMCGEVFVPGKNTYTSTVASLIDLQVDYNETNNKIVDAITLMSSLKWMVPKGAGVAKSALTKKHGEIVEYNYPLRPEISDIKPLPNYVFTHLDNIKTAWEDISGQHQVSQARAPGANSPAYAIEKLLEIDDTRLGIVARNYEEAESSMWRWVLKILHKFVMEDRMIRIAGKHKMCDVEAWYSADALVGKSGVDYFDVHIDLMSGVSESAASQREAIIQLLQNQALQPAVNPDDKELVLEEMSFTQENTPMMEELREDQSKAMYDIRMMKKGIPVPVMYYDNHGVALRIKNRFRKSLEFNTLPPQVQNIINISCNEHESYMRGVGDMGPAQGMDTQQMAQQDAMAQQTMQSSTVPQQM